MVNGNDRDYKQEATDLREMMEAQRKGILSMTAERDKLREENNLLIRMNLSMEQQLLQLKAINTSAITSNNATQQDNATEIERLRHIVKELGGNPN
jgi:hypothetical protein